MPTLLDAKHGAYAGFCAGVIVAPFEYMKVLVQSSA